MVGSVLVVALAVLHGQDVLHLDQGVVKGLHTEFRRLQLTLFLHVLDNLVFQKVWLHALLIGRQKPALWRDCGDQLCNTGRFFCQQQVFDLAHAELLQSLVLLQRLPDGMFLAQLLIGRCFLLVVAVTQRLHGLQRRLGIGLGRIPPGACQCALALVVLPDFICSGVVVDLLSDLADGCGDKRGSFFVPLRRRLQQRKDALEIFFQRRLLNVRHRGIAFPALVHFLDFLFVQVVEFRCQPAQIFLLLLHLLLGFALLVFLGQYHLFLERLQIIIADQLQARRDLHLFQRGRPRRKSLDLAQHRVQLCPGVNTGIQFQPPRLVLHGQHGRLVLAAELHKLLPVLQHRLDHPDHVFVLGVVLGGKQGEPGLANLHEQLGEVDLAEAKVAVEKPHAAVVLGLVRIGGPHLQRFGLHAHFPVLGLHHLQVRHKLVLAAVVHAAAPLAPRQHRPLRPGQVFL